MAHRWKPSPFRQSDREDGNPRAGGSYKLTVRSAHDLWAASVRIFDFGFALDFQFRVSGFGFRMSSRLLGPDSWFSFEPN